MQNCNLNGWVLESISYVTRRAFGCDYRRSDKISRLVSGVFNEFVVIKTNVNLRPVRLTASARFRCLLSLRLASRRFAYLEPILQNLFWELVLIATPERLERLMRVDFRPINRFVKRVKFFAPSDGWPWELEDFKGVLFAPAVESISDDMDLWVHMYDGQPSYYRSFVESHWEGDPPFSDDQVLLAFKTYQTHALALRNLLLGEVLITAWTEALQSLQSVVAVKFYSIDFDPPRCDQQAVFPDIVKTHRHHGSRKGGISSLTDGTIGDAVFAAAIGCLSQAKVRIKDLKVDCALTEHFGWEDLPGWNDLGISRLQAFHFSPKVTTMSQMGLPQAADAIDAVLRRCSGSLETFTHRAHCVAPWPTDKVIKLPNLQLLWIER